MPLGRSQERLTEKNKTKSYKKSRIFFFCILIFKFLYFLLCNIVLVLPYINMNLPQVYMCSPAEAPSLLPPDTIPLGHLSVPAPSIQYHASNLDWRFVSYMTTAKETQMYRTVFCTLWERERVGWFGRMAKKAGILKSNHIQVRLWILRWRERRSLLALATPWEAELQDCQALELH